MSCDLIEIIVINHKRFGYISITLNSDTDDDIYLLLYTTLS